MMSHKVIEVDSDSSDGRPEISPSINSLELLHNQTDFTRLNFEKSYRHLINGKDEDEGKREGEGEVRARVRVRADEGVNLR